MKGCLSLIIKTIIAVLVFFGLLHLGVIDFIKDKIKENTEQKQENIIEKTKDIVDLSGIEDEYTINKNINILKNKVIIAEHNATGQKMIMLDSKDEELLTKDDISDDNLQEKLDKLTKKYKYQLVKFDKIEVTKHGKFEGLNQEIPYAKITAEISNLPVKDIEGIVGVAELENGKNLIIVSLNEKNKYSQIITEAFYKKVK